MSETFNLGLPLIAPSQSQKHVTHNEALTIADAVIHLAVISRTLADPPPAPLDGDRYLIAAGASGEWSSHDGEIAFYLDGAWRYAAVRPGWRLWSIAEEKLLVFDGSLWLDVGDIAELQNMDLLGVNTTGDASNRLAVASANVLFTHDGSDQRVKVNKNALGDTASFLFQTNFSGRAEIGLAGDDDFRFKVSPDGSAWHEAIVVDRDDGSVKFLPGTVTAPSASFGAAGDGIYQVSAGKLGFALGGVQGLRVTANGIGIGADPSSNIPFIVYKAGALSFAVQGEGSTTFILVRADASSGGGSFIAQKARGTVSTPAVVSQNDVVIDVIGRAYNGSTYADVSRARTTVISATPSSSDLESRFTGFLVPQGLGSLSEIYRFDHATGFSMFGANVVVTQNRHWRRRQYAAGALPVQNSGDEIGSSDIAAAPLVSDGTEWLTPGVKRLRAITANTTLSIPAGWAIDRVHFAETAGNAVTGGIRIGTTAGGTEVVAAQAVGANSLDTVADSAILRRVFSRTSAQTLHIQAVTAWNGASVEFSFVLRKVF